MSVIEFVAFVLLCFCVWLLVLAVVYPWMT